MMRWFPVRATRLHTRRLVCDDVTIAQASLFPFFDGSGAVKQVLAVDANSPDLWSFEPAATRLSMPFWGSVRVDGAVACLDRDIVNQLAPLWHYDPWWLLRNERFASRPETRILKHTNCAESFGDRPQNLYFSGRLTRVVGVILPSSSQGIECRRFCSDMLPVRQPLRPLPLASEPRGGWRLAPFWHCGRDSAAAAHDLEI